MPYGAWRSLGSSTASCCWPPPFRCSCSCCRTYGTGALGALFEGAVGEGVKRLRASNRGMRTAETLVRAAWLVYPVLLSSMRFPGKRRVLRVVALLWRRAAPVVVSQRRGYRRLWFFGTSVFPSPWRPSWWPVIAPGALGAPSTPYAGAGKRHRARALNQFPFSAPNYFGYVAPLAILMAGAAAAHFRALSRVRTAFHLLAGFGLLLRVGSVYNLGYFPAWWDYAHRLAVPRGGLLVTRQDSVRYTRVLQLVASHRATGAVFAGPELPEVYFLSGTTSPGRDSYSLFSAAVRDSTQLPRVLDEAVASVIVIKTHPMFVRPLGDDVLPLAGDSLSAGRVARQPEVRWRVPR